MTHCTTDLIGFQPLGSREIVARFDAPAVTSDAGGLLLREVDLKFGFIQRFAECFSDHRNPKFVTHDLPALLAQRICGIALGYEDLNDHDAIRHDPLMAVLAGKSPSDNPERPAIAGRNTLNRLELTPVGANKNSRYKKIVANHSDIENFFVDAFLVQNPMPPKRIVLDLDATDDPIHGHQAGRFFHGFYESYCYLPLYIFCGQHLLCAKLRPADIDAAAGALKQVRRIVERIRHVWPEVEIVLRADSGFCRENIMAWCEANTVKYVFGLAKNKRLIKILGGELHQAKEESQRTGQAARVFKDFIYRTQKSWSAERRVVGKAEHLAKGSNPRFVVTNLSVDDFDAKTLYEREYCGRGNMENRIKEQQLYLFADRTSASTMRANQLRLWLSSVAYVLVNAVRDFGLKETELSQAQSHTIRTKLFKIGASIRLTVRKIWVSMSKSNPYQAVFFKALENIRLVTLPVRMWTYSNSG
jgi:Transposase DDE domain group 1